MYMYSIYVVLITQYNTLLHKQQDIEKYFKYKK